MGVDSGIRVGRHLPDESRFSTYSLWATTSVITSVLILTLAPELSIRHSYLLTAATTFMVQCFLYLFYSIVLFPRFFSPLRHLPGPTGGSFFNGQWTTITSQPTGIPLRQWANDIPNDGLIRYLHLFNKERVLLTSPKSLAEVLTVKSYDFQKPALLQQGIGKLLGIGILLAEGDEHKHQRKGLAPAFNFRHVKQLYPIFWQKAREMVLMIGKDLDKKAPENVEEVGEWASRATLDIIGVAGMGQDFNSLADPDTELNKTYRSIFNPSGTAQILGLLQFFLPNWFLRNLPIKRNDDIVAASRLARDTSRQLVRRKQEQMEKKHEVSPDIISVALESGVFSEDKLVDNMMTFLAAGHETTASSFTWAVHMMCKHPEVQSRLRDEIRSHISSLDETIDDAKIDGMPYLHAVCHEVLRFYAPVPVTLRVAACDTSIVGQFIPKGTTVIMAPWSTNQNKQLWGSDAEEFNPDRWMAPGQANSGGAVSNYAFLTFLHGPRSCIGQRFAIAEFACLLAAFVGRYSFEMRDPDEKIEIKGGITARPRHGMNLKLTHVDGW